MTRQEFMTLKPGALVVEHPDTWGEWVAQAKRLLVRPRALVVDRIEGDKIVTKDERMTWAEWRAHWLYLFSVAIGA